MSDDVRQPHGSASCACLFCWHDIATLAADLAAERAKVEALRNALGEAHMNLAMFYPEGGKPGDRIVDGGRMGTIVTCPTCDGDGILHDPDEKPEPSTPEGGPS